MEPEDVRTSGEPSPDRLGLGEDPLNDWPELPEAPGGRDVPPAPVTLVLNKIPYALPWHIGRKWMAIQQLIRSIYLREAQRCNTQPQENCQKPLLEEPGPYDVLHSSGQVILPELWESTAFPGIRVSIRFWSDIFDTEGLSEAYQVNDSREEAPSSGLLSSGAYGSLTERSASRGNADLDASLEAPGGYDNTELHAATSETAAESSPASESDGRPDYLFFSDHDLEINEPPTVVSPGRAIDESGNVLSFQFDPSTRHQSANNSESGQDPQWRWPRALSLPQNGCTLHRADVSASILKQKMNSKASIALFPTKPETVPDWKWLHIQRDCLDIEEFKTLALRTPGLEDDLRQVIEYTFGKVGGKMRTGEDTDSIQSGTVIRVDGKRSSTEPQGHTTHSVVFLCLPYLNVVETVKPWVSNRSLFQPSNPWLASRDRERHQALGRFYRESGSKHIIHVPHFFALIIDEVALITNGAMTLDDLRGPSIDWATNNSSSLRVMNESGEGYLLPIHQYDTLMEVEKALQQQLNLPNTYIDATKISNWYHMFASNKPDISHVCVRQFQTKPIGDRKLDHCSGTLFDLEQSLERQNGDQISPSMVPLLLWQSVDAPIPGTSYELQHGSGMNKAGELHTNPHAENLQFNVSKIEKNLRKPRAVLLLQSEDNQFCMDFSGTNYYDAMRTERITQPIATSQSSTQDSDPAFDRTRPQGGESEYYSSFQQVQLKTTARNHKNIMDKATKYKTILHEFMALFFPREDRPTELKTKWLKTKLLTETEYLADFMALANQKACHPKEPKFLIFPDIRVIDKTVDIPESRKPHLRFSKVKLCHTLRFYNNLETALDHLAKEHCESAAEDETASDKPSVCHLLWYVTDTQWIQVHDRLQQYESLISLMVQTLEFLANTAKRICFGVAPRKGPMAAHLRLPNSLVNSFELFALFTLTAERLSREIGAQVVEPWTTEKRDLRQKVFEDGYELLTKISNEAKREIDRARVQIRQMIEPQNPPAASRNLSLGPGCILSWVLRRLVLRDLSCELKIPGASEVYADCFETLKHNATRNPCKALIRDIGFFEEEVQAVEGFKLLACNTLKRLSSVLDPDTHPATGRRRRVLYEIERNIIDKAIDELEDELEDLRNIAGSCGPLTWKAKTSVEINEEDHGKAIFVFTVVTTIFLPLSFVTSFLGMNTTDVRDTTWDQSLFWIIALPVTFTIMAMVLGVAYNSNKLKGQLQRLRRTTDKDDRRVRKERKRRQVGERDTEHAFKNPDTDSAEFDSPLTYTGRGTGTANPDLFKTYLQDQGSRREKPTYVKVHKDHLAIETLTYYGLAWEWDRTDPDYIIILRELDPREADILFEHTKRIRSS